MQCFYRFKVDWVLNKIMRRHIIALCAFVWVELLLLLLLRLLGIEFERQTCVLLSLLVVEVRLLVSICGLFSCVGARPIRPKSCEGSFINYSTRDEG